ncbi:MAG TPA: hypothetical protein VHD85_07190 [Terracidiphilus sp.]|nr:hypothetical protein [Terracidiphilus sp.]
MNQLNSKAERTLLKELSNTSIAFIGFVSVLVLCCILFCPSLDALLTWLRHRTATFEKENLVIPTLWVPGESGHLLSLRKPRLTVFSHWESYIVIDPFAERHSKDLDFQRKHWLNSQGFYGDGKLTDPRTGKVAGAFSAVQCAPTKFSSSETLIHISCLSADSLLEFDFMGNPADFPAFQDIFSQATDAASRHPGTVRP